MLYRRLLHPSIPGLALLASVLAPAADLQITGPYTHENLSIFLVHGSKNAASGKLLTLQEAMDQQKVSVYETGQVNELSIENRSSIDVYIQSGDIVKGGRQDRVLTLDIILPAHSGKIPISAFCVEHGRWTRRGNEESAQFSSSTQSLPARSLKIAVREDKDQSKVWEEVAKTQTKLSAGSAGYARAMAQSPSPTSMQLALENKAVAEQTSAYVQSLARIIEGRGDVVGYAYAINGKLNSAEIYSSHDLFLRMWPKMLQASAAEAVGERNGNSAAPPDAKSVNATLAAADRGQQVAKDNTGRVSVIKKTSDKVVLFEAHDRDETVHKSYVVK